MVNRHHFPGSLATKSYEKSHQWPPVATGRNGHVWVPGVACGACHSFAWDAGGMVKRREVDQGAMSNN